MAKQAGKFAPVFDLQDPQTASILGVGPNLAGFGSAANLGTGSVKDYQTLMAGVPAGERESFLQYQLMNLHVYHQFLKTQIVHSLIGLEFGVLYFF